MTKIEPVQGILSKAAPSPLSAGTSNDAAPNYLLGASYAFVTAVLLALQEPFSALAARQLRSVDFLAFTQVALLISIPLLLVRPVARHDFTSILTTMRNWPKLIALLAVGCAGLLLYDIALSSAHPIITAAVLNLSPFWPRSWRESFPAKAFPVHMSCS